MYGEVANSGRFGYLPGRTLSDYISYAGGPREKANLGAVTVTRQVSGEAVKYTINAGDILYNGNHEKDIEILKQAWQKTFDW